MTTRYSPEVQPLLVAAMLLATLANNVAAKSFEDTRGEMRDLVAEVERLQGEATPSTSSPLSIARTGWAALTENPPGCLVGGRWNDTVVSIGFVGPFERTDGLDFVILSRGMAAEWGNAPEAVSLLVSRRFDARSGEPAGELFFEGGYFSSPGSFPLSIVGTRTWTDSPRPSSFPPAHRPWGGPLTLLARSIGKCRRLLAR